MADGGYIPSYKELLQYIFDEAGRALEMKVSNYLKQKPEMEGFVEDLIDMRELKGKDKAYISQMLDFYFETKGMSKIVAVEADD